LNLWFRLVWALLSWRSRGPVSLWEVGSRSFRVWPTDLDIFNHKNNGKYLSLMDLGRFDILLRSGTWKTLGKKNWYPVVVAETITFRKSLAPWVKFEIESKILGWDEEAFYVEQRFTVRGEIYASAVVRLRFLARPRGVVTPQMLLDYLGAPEVTPVLPTWVAEWSKTVALPKGKEPAPSTWN
jgi:acyl-CoA thioesterase FadM